MCPPYYEMIRSQNPSFDLRYRLVQTALQHGIRATSRLFGCSRNTVPLWLRRYQQEGKPGLKERSRAPHRIPHKTPPEVEQRVLQARDTRSPVSAPHGSKRSSACPARPAPSGASCAGTAAAAARNRARRAAVHQLGRAKVPLPATPFQPAPPRSGCTWIRQKHRPRPTGAGRLKDYPRPDRAALRSAGRNSEVPCCPRGGPRAPARAGRRRFLSDAHPSCAGSSPRA